MKGAILVIVFATAVMMAAAQTTNDYRTIASGNWNSTSTWQRFDGADWIAATATPTSSTANLITVRNGHTVTSTAAVTIDQVVIEAGGKLIASVGTITIANGTGTDMTVSGTLEKVSDLGGTGTIVFANGGKYIHNRNGDVLPVATWDDGSTCEITGVTTTQPGNRNQNFYNLTWNCPNQTANENSTGGDFKDFRGLLSVVSTGTGSWTWTDTNNNTKNINDYEQSGGTVYMTQGSGNIVVTLTGDFVMTGGTLSENGSATGCSWIFTEPGTQLFNKSGGTISQTISFTIDSGTTVDVVDQPFTGLGNFTLASGAGIIIRDAAGITTSGTAGAVQVSGTRTYNAAANYIYSGMVAQATGNGLSTANNLTIDNAAGVTLTNSVTVNGTLYQIAGALSGTIAADGYDSQYLDIAETSQLMGGFSANVSTPALMPGYVDRYWSLAGDYTGSKTVTFYWTSADDGDYDWTGLEPAVFNGTTKYTGTYDVSSTTRSITVTIPSSIDGSDWRIGRADDEPLPVVLSSFTGTSSAQNGVTLTWVTQSETGMLGYYVYRAATNQLSGAQAVSPMIAALNTAQQQIYTFTDTAIDTEGTYYYWLQAADLNGEETFHGPISVYYSGLGDNPTPGIPLTTELKAIYPNPFNPHAYIPYSVATTAEVRLQIYNFRGQLIRDFDLGLVIPGEYRAEWDGTDANGQTVSNGVYYIRMLAGMDSFQRKAVLMK